MTGMGVSIDGRFQTQSPSAMPQQVFCDYQYASMNNEASPVF